MIHIHGRYAVSVVWLIRVKHRNGLPVREDEDLLSLQVRILEHLNSQDVVDNTQADTLICLAHEYMYRICM